MCISNPPAEFTHHSLRSDVLIAVIVLLEIIRCAEIGVVATQFVGDSAKTADTFKTAEEIAFRVRLDALHFLFCRSVCHEGRDLLVNHRPDLVKVSSRSCGHDDGEFA